MEGWVDGWVDGLKAILRIAYSNQKYIGNGTILLLNKINQLFGCVRYINPWFWQVTPRGPPSNES